MKNIYTISHIETIKLVKKLTGNVIEFDDTNWTEEQNTICNFIREAMNMKENGDEMGKIWTLYCRDEYDHFSGAVEDVLTNWVENWLYA